MTLFLDETAGPPGMRRRSRTGARIAIGASLVLAAIALAAIAPWDAGRRQEIADRITVWTQPSPRPVVQLAEATAMSDTGELIFLASTPELESDASFNEHCDVAEQTVLGCYTDGEIFIFQVTDPRLAGTTEVTAAHEMLHAGYERLSGAERAALDALVDAFVATLPPGHAAFAILAGYDERQWPDEWHSRLGTEFAALSPELEAHYARYFDDRSIVVALHAQSQRALQEVRERIDALVAEIDALEAAISERSARYEAELADLDSDIADFNRRARTPGAFGSYAAFESERNALLARSDALEQERLALNAEVERHNRLVVELEGLDATYTDLYESLDSHNAPPPLQP